MSAITVSEAAALLGISRCIYGAVHARSAVSS